VLTVFDGFQNINQYRSARETEQEGFLKREQLCLSILLEVLNARLEADRAADRLKLAECNLETIELEWKEIQARWREGLIRVSEYLEAESRRDEAQRQLAQARYRHQVARAALADVMGGTRKESSQS
jgi:outer membrane protein TolC